MSERDPRAIRRDERAWQDVRGGSLQERTYERPGTRVVLDRQFARIGEALALEPASRVLDLGCGVGLLLAWLQRGLPGTYVGLDLSLASLFTAKKTNPHVPFAVGDAESLPFANGSFDRVVCSGSAHHFLDEQTAFREMFRVLAPGGRAVLYEPTASLLTNVVRWLFLRGPTYESPADLAHKTHFSADRVRDALASAGFSSISWSSHDFLAYPLSGNYMRSPLGRSKSIMSWLGRVEDRLSRIEIVRRMAAHLSWRLLVVARKDPAAEALPRRPLG
jgi:ubiquinone/menaquinone biosynthesis C-methylase UbiE